MSGFGIPPRCRAKNANGGKPRPFDFGQGRLGFPPYNPDTGRCSAARADSGETATGGTPAQHYPKERTGAAPSGLRSTEAASSLRLRARLHSGIFLPMKALFHDSLAECGHAPSRKRFLVGLPEFSARA